MDVETKLEWFTSGTPYRNDCHPQKAFQVLNTMRMQKLWFDVVLVVGDMEISAHRMVLAICSQYFYAMFSGFKEVKQDRIEFQQIDPEALKSLIDYMYTSEISVTDDNVKVILAAADMLQLDDVHEACCKFLFAQLNPNNCLETRAFADLHTCTDLLAKTDKYIEREFEEVVKSEEYLSLTSIQVVQLISRDRINVPSEEKVFECVMAWVKEDLENRRDDLPTLMQHVRLPLLSLSYLIDRVDEELLMTSDAICHDLVMQAFKYHALEAVGRLELKYQSSRTVPRNPKALLVVGGHTTTTETSAAWYDFNFDTWNKFAHMSTPRRSHGLVVLEDKVYAVGGYNRPSYLSSVEVYDVLTDTWSSCTDMQEQRSGLCVEVVKGCIYALGGWNSENSLNSVEKFNLRSSKWCTVSPMKSKRCSFGVGVVNGLLYAVGGVSVDSALCSAERYDPDKDQWNTIGDMSENRFCLGVGVLDGILYAVGGTYRGQVSKTVEAYDPKSGKWSFVADMLQCRESAGVVGYNGKLYVIGGEDGNTKLASVEVYDPMTNTWSLLPTPMEFGRCEHGVTLIDKPLQKKP